jgi:hypothetical protein
MVVRTYYPSYLGNINKRIAVQTSRGYFETLSQKYLKSKKAGDMIQVVEPSRHKALSSNHSAAKRDTREWPQAQSH